MSEWFKEYIDRMEKENFDKTNKNTIIRSLNKRIRNYIDPPPDYQHTNKQPKITPDNPPKKIVSKL